ncbi:hypothetical protein PYW07_010634 [Mythimna separata]|uniref:NADPH oxidase 5 n=1 Tax=Mythimna separata TaxID=271217 RepID=A0AAD8DMJ3_MYTSE|nr:hypothetical protein PYW07_010634 [Mythimna separata]
MASNGKAPEITTNFETIDLDKKDENGTHLGKNGKFKGQFAVHLAAINGQYDGNCLGVPRAGHRPSIMEVECAKERTRLALLKQCSAILKQGDQKYTKESLHRTFQDEDLLERIFRLFDADSTDHLVQNDWLEYLKGRLTEDKQIDFVEQVESVAYVLCGNGVITLDTFQRTLQNKVVTNKLFRVVDTDGDGYATADEIMEFLSTVTSSRPRVGFDKHSVDRLEKLFRATVGDEKEITREQFQKIVVSKNPFFTERVFQIFDEDDSGAISLQEFIAAVHRFAGQTPEDKIRFLFKVYDLDGDGLIQHRELAHVMRACMEENGMQFSDEQLLHLTTAMFEDADCEQRGAITYEALKKQLGNHEGLLENLSISIDRWLVPPKQDPKPVSLAQRLWSLKPYQLSLPYFRNNYVYLTYLAIFFIVNAGLFVARVVEYRRMNANGFVIVARACGQCLNFTCSWVLVLMLRHCLTELRVRGFSSYLPLDHHIYLHKLTGVLIVLYSILHTVMHLCNFSLIVVHDPVLNANNYTLSEWLLTEKPGLFGMVGGCANPTGVALAAILLVMFVCSQPFIRRGGSFEVRNNYTLTEKPGLFGMVGGCANPTGVALAAILLVMFVCSQPFIRRGGSFEVRNNYTLTEKPGLFGMVGGCANPTGVALAAILLVMFVCSQPFIRRGGSFEVRNNYTLTEKPGLFGMVGGCANPTGVALAAILLVMFVCSQPFIRRGGSFEIFYWTHLLYVPFWLLLLMHAPNFWKWFVVPGTIYVSERIMRLAWMRSERGKTYISSGILLPSRVTHLVVKRPPLFHFHAGDYVFVNIPAIATYEWHPFTISSAPEQEDYVFVNIPAIATYEWHPFTISSAPEQEDYIWLHIRGVGQWTNRLYTYFEREQARLHGEDLPAIESGHEKLARSISGQSKKSRKGSVGSTKKRSVDFSPRCYSNDAYVGDEGSGDGKLNEAPKSPTKVSYNPSLLLAPARTLEKSRSMPDVQKNVKKRQRLMALRDFMRSESESKLDESSMRSARKSFGLACKIPQNKSLVHSFRYMRTKPTIIAFKTPSFDERRRSNDSILTLARRRLSKSLSPDRDVESQPDKIVEVDNDGSVVTDDFESNYPIGKPLEIYLDGPYGAASSHIFLAQHAALVAAGIGVTPFASILQAVMYRYWSARHACPKCGHAWATDMPRHNMNLKKVDFFWINREQRSFEWFVSLLSQLEIEQAELGGALDRFLDMHMYITSALQKSDMKAVGLQLALDLLHEKEKRDLITGLKTRTNAGRPNWDKVFKQLQEQNKGKVTVFYCGPPQLAKILRVKCDQFGFGFRKEVF